MSMVCRYGLAVRFGEANQLSAVGWTAQNAGKAGKAVRDLSAQLRPCLFSAENFLWSYAGGCMFFVVLCSTRECGPAEEWIKEHSHASPPIPLFSVSVQAPVQLTSECAQWVYLTVMVHVVWVTRIWDQRARSLCWSNELLYNRSSETGAGRTPAAGAFASGHLFSDPGTRKHVLLMGVCRRSTAAILFSVRSSLGRTPIFGLPFRPCRLGPLCTYTPASIWWCCCCWF